EVDAALAQDLRDGLHAVVVGDYEFGRNLQRAQPGDAPLRFLLYARCERLSRDEADAWLAQQDGGGPPSIAGVAHVAKSVSRDAFDAAIAAVHIALPDGGWVVSCSPELFVEKHGDVLRARPMKGTAPRSADPHEDAAAAAFLANDPKNRAENVMIVDL
ncbi:chorismate-binding protein, partial [Burkholderia gladioli]|uniref:chorismate-binding protein n=1 Tax=Burkholderia gladioli TaxID=28095 RepID=UPI001641B0C3